MNIKDYKINLVKSFYNTEKLIFISTNINFNSNSFRLLKKKLSNYYLLKLLKIKNNIFKIMLKNSIHNFLASYFNNLVCFITKLKCSNILNTLPIKNNFYILGIKLNNKFYSKKKLTKLLCFNYYQVKKILFQFIIVNLKKIKTF